MDNTDANLSHEDKKEDHEVEGTVAPVGKKDMNKGSEKHPAVPVKTTEPLLLPQFCKQLELVVSVCVLDVSRCIWSRLYQN